MNIEVSQNFKKMTTKAIFSIVLFIFVYLILVILAISVTFSCLAMAFLLIFGKPSPLTIGLGAGLAGFGGFILFFMIKFLFTSHKIDKSYLTEITQQQEPRLFEFIQHIVDEVETDFPKRIYLSTDVNACVFYDSSFWSMFFPIKKNLQIGLGLINSVSEQEFKAILAHEFGHFSQKSMKVGSYVYNVNKVIYNMLYDNQSFDKAILYWANMNGYFSFFIGLALRVIKAIQWVLKKMYDFINISYMALSREMEFHADAVATHVAGSLPLKESLLRLQLADYSYNSVLNFYEGKIANNIKSNNIFKEQQFVMNFLAKENDLPFKNNLPFVSENDLNKYNKSKLQIKDQWASHPSTEERIQAFEALNIVKSNSNNQSAMDLLRNTTTLEEQLTQKLFANVNYQEPATILAIEDFEKNYTEAFDKDSFPKKYNSYYDSKNPNYFEIDAVRANHNFSFDELFSNEKVDLIYEHIALINDQNALTQIALPASTIKTFDYDGQRYTAKEAENLSLQLNQVAENIKVQITENDKNIYAFFLAIAQQSNQENKLREKYLKFFEIDREYDTLMELYTKLINATDFIHVVTPFTQIYTNFNNITLLEEELKTEIHKLLENRCLETEITHVMRENFELYLSKKWDYFINDNYENDNLNILFKAIHNFNYLVARNFLLIKIRLLNFQVYLLEQPLNEAYSTNI